MTVCAKRGRRNDIPVGIWGSIAGPSADIRVTATGYCYVIRPPANVINAHVSEKLPNVRGARVVEGTMNIASRQYDCNFRRRQQGVKEIQGYELVLIFTWLGALLTWGFLWWAAFRLLCGMVQLVRYVPGLLR